MEIWITSLRSRNFQLDSLPGQLRWAPKGASSLFIATAIRVTTRDGLCSTGNCLTLTISASGCFLEEWELLLPVSQTRHYVQVQVPADFDYGKYSLMLSLKLTAKSAERLTSQSRLKRSLSKKRSYVVDESDMSDRELIQRSCSDEFRTSLSSR